MWLKEIQVIFIHVHITLRPLLKILKHIFNLMRPALLNDLPECKHVREESFRVFRFCLKHYSPMLLIYISLGGIDKQNRAVTRLK